MTGASFTPPTKPLGGKAYGSIGHLPNSRLGPGDWHIHEGQMRILTEKPRKGDRIIITEKLDGACMAVANIDGEIVPLTRAGYRARHGVCLAIDISAGGASLGPTAGDLMWEKRYRQLG